MYGTLKDSQTRKHIIGRAVSGVPDTLKDFKETTVSIGGVLYPCAEPQRNSSIDGLVVAVTQSDLRLLDVFETEAYKRTRAELESGKSAWVYVENS